MSSCSVQACLPPARFGRFSRVWAFLRTICPPGSQEVLELDPLPCWRHLSPEQYRVQVAGLIECIEAEAAVRRKETGIEPLGPAAILRQSPFARPRKSKRSSAPRVHAISKSVRDAIYEGYA